MTTTTKQILIIIAILIPLIYGGIVWDRHRQAAAAIAKAEFDAEVKRRSDASRQIAERLAEFRGVVRRAKEAEKR